MRARELRWGAKAMAGLLAVAVGVPFLVLTVAASASGRDEAIDGLHRLPGAAAATFRLAAGRQVVYQELPGDDAGPRVVDVEVEGPDGRLLPTKPAGEGEPRYTHDGRHGQAFLSFRVAEAGEHTVRIAGVGTDDVVVAVGPEVPDHSDLLVTVLMVAMVGTLVVGSVLIARTAIRRSTSPADA